MSASNINLFEKYIITILYVYNEIDMSLQEKKIHLIIQFQQCKRILDRFIFFFFAK